MVDSKNASHSGQGSCYANQTLTKPCDEDQGLSEHLILKSNDEKFHWTEEQQDIVLKT